MGARVGPSSGGEPRAGVGSRSRCGARASTLPPSARSRASLRPSDLSACGPAPCALSACGWPVCEQVPSWPARASGPTSGPGTGSTRWNLAATWRCGHRWPHLHVALHELRWTRTSTTPGGERLGWSAAGCASSAGPASRPAGQCAPSATWPRADDAPRTGWLGWSSLRMRSGPGSLAAEVGSVEVHGCAARCRFTFSHSPPGSPVEVSIGFDEPPAPTGVTSMGAVT